MDNFKIGDRFYCLWNQDVFTLMSIKEGWGEPAFNLNWRKYDNDRHRYNHCDGLVTVTTLERGTLSLKPFYKIKDDKHLLQLELKYG